MSILTTFIVKKTYKPEPNRNLEKTNRNQTVSSEPRVTDISFNRGSPTNMAATNIFGFTFETIHTQRNLLYIQISVCVLYAYDWEWVVFQDVEIHWGKLWKPGWHARTASLKHTCPSVTLSPSILKWRSYDLAGTSCNFCQSVNNRTVLKFSLQAGIIALNLPYFGMSCFWIGAFILVILFRIDSFRM